MTPSIRLNNISKRYRIGKGVMSIRELLNIRNISRSQKYHWAVKELSFELQPGEALGIIGPNGAGKTTILKILSQVTQQTSGELIINGRLSALIELGAGFHPDLTGRENIFLNGTILGMQRSDLKERFDRIVSFAGIGNFLDTPVKRYSSGMYARLGFAIAAHVDPQILLVDEVLAVGDYAFQQKCYARMDELRDHGTSLILVSHNMEAIRRVCDKGLVMYQGENIFHGSSADAIVAYSTALREAARKIKLEVPMEEGLSQRIMTFDAEIRGVSLLNLNSNPISSIKSGDTLIVCVEIHFHLNVQQPVFSCTLRTPDGRLVYDTTTRWMNISTPNFTAGERCQVRFVMNLHLLEGEYQVGVDVASSNFSHYYDRFEHAENFWVVSGNGAKGIADLEAKIEIETIETLAKLQ